MYRDKLIRGIANRDKIRKFLSKIPFGLSLISIITVIYDIGFDQHPFIEMALAWVYVSMLVFNVLFLILRYLFFRVIRPPKKVWLFDLILISGLIVLVVHWLKWTEVQLLQERLWMYLALFLVFVRELFAREISLKRKYLNPAQLFIGSFFLMIVSGAFLLMLPNATVSGISLIDALFTSTSAICVTGLVVVDTGSYFTLLGQYIILVLIQLGGLGIMTFTSYFSYFFRGGASYENQLLLKDIANAEKIAEIYRTFNRILILTFTIEGIGAVLIYYNLHMEITAVSRPIFFSVFHSVSAFCNAGFSVLSNGLYEPGFRFNYGLQSVISFLFVFGGLGFPIVFNLVRYMKHLFVNRFMHFIRFKKGIHHPWVININARIVVITTLVLLVGGTGLVYIFESTNTLAEHTGFGKIVTAFFTAATPRTAGFNVVDMSLLRQSTLLIILFLMWIGASPASTGGGIKTSTFAVSILNAISIARGKSRIEIFHREISQSSVKRASAIIFLSMLVIGISIVLLTLLETDKPLFSIVFECVSAFGTVGLSLGITDSLCSGSKLIIVLTMFIGRVSMLAILIAFLRKTRYVAYRHPTEEILIN